MKTLSALGLIFFISCSSPEIKDGCEEKKQQSVVIDKQKSIRATEFACEEVRSYEFEFFPVGRFLEAGYFCEDFLSTLHMREYFLVGCCQTQEELERVHFVQIDSNKGQFGGQFMSFVNNPREGESCFKRKLKVSQLKENWEKKN